MSTVRTNVETRLTIYIIGLTALGGLFGRQLHKHSTWGMISYGTAFVFVLLMFAATLMGFPRERAEDSV